MWKDVSKQAFQSFANDAMPLDILVIENEAIVRNALVALFAMWNCRVLDAPSIEAAERRLRVEEFPAQIIVTDLHLDNAGSETALDSIPDFMERTGLSVPVIMITGDTDPNRRWQAQTKGWSLLVKPFSCSSLRHSIGEAVLRTAQN